MTLRVVEWGFRNRRLEGYFARDFDPEVLAVREDLRSADRRARELEAREYHERPLSFKWKDKHCYAASELSEVDPDAVRALRPCIEQDAPDWVESVREEWDIYRRLDDVVHWSGVPIQAAVAILLNLYERGEIEAEDI